MRESDIARKKRRRSTQGSDSGKGQEPLRVIDQDRLDLGFAELAPAHHRHDVPEDVAIAMAAEIDQAGAIADVVADDDAVEVTTVDQRARRIAAFGDDELGDLLGQVLMASGMDVEAGAGLLLIQDRALQYRAFELAPGSRGADLVDDSGTVWTLPMSSLRESLKRAIAPPLGNSERLSG